MRHKTDPPIAAALHGLLEKHSYGSTLNAGADAPLDSLTGQHITST